MSRSSPTVTIWSMCSANSAAAQWTLSQTSPLSSTCPPGSSVIAALRPCRATMRPSSSSGSQP